jgi:hypothetical protein
MPETLESILVVYQNAATGRQDRYDEWYTNIHIRDAMRIDGAIATQRFIVGKEQPVLDGERIVPAFWAHTIYEWESAEQSVRGHERAGTPLMEISRDCAFEGLRDYFYRPEYLSHGWTPQAGFRRGEEILTALIIPSGAGAAFVDWFRERHAPDTLALDGFGSAAVFSLHEAQSLPNPAEHPFVAIYGLTASSVALRAWARRHDERSATDLTAMSDRVEIGCWQPRIARLRALEVTNPTAEAAAREQRAREKYQGNYLTQEELERALTVGRTVASRAGVGV